MRVEIWTELSSQPRIIEGVSATYQKGSFFCIAQGDKRYKMPIDHIYWVVETDFTPSLKEEI